MNLFQTGDFTLRSGAKSKWRIECDALTKEDWDGIAAIAAELLAGENVKFGLCFGVPRGGLPFADALQKYAQMDGERYDTKYPTLIVEDVVTTGGSMELYREKLGKVLGPGGTEFIGVSAFARGNCPDWVYPLFQLNSKRQTKKEIDRQVAALVKDQAEWSKFKPGDMK